MQRMKRMAAFMTLALSVLLFAGCGTSEFGMTENTEKQMTITAQKAAKDAFFMVGSLEVEDGEQIVISSGLTKGSVRVEIIGAPAEQSIDQLPELNGEAVITADVTTAEGATGTVPAGSYYVKATCLEKADGTIQIAVKPAE